MNRWISAILEKNRKPSRWERAMSYEVRRHEIPKVCMNSAVATSYRERVPADCSEPGHLIA